MTLLERETVATGPRVRLRPFTRADVDAWQAWPNYDDPLLIGSSPRRLSPGQRAHWFDDLVNRQRQIPFSIDDEHGHFIGRLFLRKVRYDEGTSVLGIDLDPRKLSQGYGTEALRVFLSYYFGALGLREMQLSVAAFNERARRSYASLGFRLIGSHWDSHAGPDVTRDERFAHIHHLFRRGILGLDTLFYDMALDRATWQARTAGE